MHLKDPPLSSPLSDRGFGAVHGFIREAEASPGGVDGFRQRAAAGFPGREVVLWSRENLLPLRESLIYPEALLSSFPGLGLGPATARLEILRLFGGVFISGCLLFSRPLDEITLEGCICMAQDETRRVSPTLLSSPSGHPLWEAILRRMAERIRENAFELLRGVRLEIEPLSLHSLLLEYLDGTPRCRPAALPGGHIAGWLFEEHALFVWSPEIIHVCPEFRRCPARSHPRRSAPGSYPLYGVQQWTGSWVMETL